MSVGPDEIRQRVAAAIHARLGPSALQDGEAWRESTWLWEVFAATPDRFAHRHYAVGVIGTDVQDSPRRRGTYCQSWVHVRWAWRIKADAQRASLDAALLAEREVLRAVHAADATGMGVPVPVRIRRAVDEDGQSPWLITDAQWTVLHPYDIGRF